jgi:ketosteroid isomerase-like protein
MGNQETLPMPHPNFDLIDQFFAAYGRRDMAALRQVLTEDATWTFPGRNPFSGTRRGLDEIVAFFDALGSVMGRSNVQGETLLRSANEGYVAEVQHIRTARVSGLNLDHEWCVLWTFRDGKIAAGRHLAADQYAVDEFFGEMGR